MAGKGPAPAEAKRRRNKPQIDELPAEGHRGEFPALPKSYRHDKKTVPYLKATRVWYQTWARSPMATEFTGVDWQRLLRVAPLVDQYERTAARELLAEIRLQEASFGGTPLDRRRLGLRVRPPAATDADAAERKQGSRPSGRRARLSVVK
jgi:hypothetical protein